PQALTLPDSLLKLLPPRPPDYPRTRESFGGHTGLTFDPEGPVEAAAELTASLLFDPSRASRLVEDHASDPQQLGLQDLLDAVLDTTWRAPRLNGLDAETQFTVENVILNHLLQLAANGGGSSQSPGAALPAGVSLNVAASSTPSGQARAIALAEIDNLEKWLKTIPAETESPEAAAHRAAAIAEIEQFRKAPSAFIPPPGVAVPPGQPIGDDVDE
ncbi:MAG TPA: zinc-dependent metalloprotease, partial [Terracidiphilus sp.]|nr:zinc-dependent metalloprotease [Terracidiphilus sp.]